jgi:protein-tyrosine-phosphatase
MRIRRAASRPRPTTLAELAEAARLADVFRISFVCTGNRARSPLAAALFSQRTRGLPVQVASYGVLDVGPKSALAAACEVGRTLGVDLSDHRSSTLRGRVLVDADLVIGFEAAHLAAASDVGGADTERVFLLLDLPVLLQGIRADPDAVPLASARNVVERMMQRRGSLPSVREAELADPYGAPRHAFAEMARVVDAMVGLLASSLFAPQRDTLS